VKLKDIIIREHHDGLWFVLAEEYSSDQGTPSDSFVAGCCTAVGNRQNS
jgi:hypothetical protein